MECECYLHFENVREKCRQTEGGREGGREGGGGVSREVPWEGGR